MIRSGAPPKGSLPGPVIPGWGRMEYEAQQGNARRNQTSQA